MRILIDADGCPVVDITVRLAKRYGIECLILCDTSHEIQRDGVQTLIFSKGADSVDFGLVNLVRAGDIVVTQDYGLAAMCLARNAVPVSQDGMEYNADNIDALLLARHTEKKIRNACGRLRGPVKRRPEQDSEYDIKLAQMILRIPGIDASNRPDTF